MGFGSYFRKAPTLSVAVGGPGFIKPKRHDSIYRKRLYDTTKGVHEFRSAASSYPTAPVHCDPVFGGGESKSRPPAPQRQAHAGGPTFRYVKRRQDYYNTTATARASTSHGSNGSTRRGRRRDSGRGFTDEYRPISIDMQRTRNMKTLRRIVARTTPYGEW
jgi:hypothetical protein